MIDINVQLVDFKVTSSDEMVRHNEDGSYTILLNSRQATNRQISAYKEALGHIMRGECDQRDGNVQEIEYDAHEGNTPADF